MSETLSNEAQGVVEKVEKLLRLAAKNPNEAEAASATAKAQELLAAFNLDMSAVEKHGGGTGKRAEEELEGGFYEFERDLWKAVASLNFCLHFSSRAWKDGGVGPRGGYRRGKMVFTHQIVGRTVNIAATKAMATYLQQVSERIARERCERRGVKMNSSWAISMRTGIAERLEEKIYARRQTILDEEKRKAMEAEAKAREAARNGISLETAVTLSSYVASEREANIDFVFGEGTSAKWAAERAEQARKQREADEAYTQWAQAHPEEAAEEERKRAEEVRRQAEKRAGKQREKYNAAYFIGYEAAANVSIDLQAEATKTAGALL